MNYIDIRCNETYHVFARAGEDIAAYHLDGDFYRVCESAEFNLTELLEDDLPTMNECPWCLRHVVGTEHIRKCSNYKPAPTADETRDAYSHPAEQAKRDGLLSRLD